MKYPKLALPFALKTPIQIYVTNGLSEDGEPEGVLIYEGLCHLNEKSKKIVNKDKKEINLSASVIIDGDIADHADIDGYVQINSVNRTIYSVQRGRNPDGTVNFIQLELF